MADTSPIAGGPTTNASTTYRPQCSATFPVGTPLRTDPAVDGAVLPARGDNLGDAAVIAVAASPGIATTVGTKHVCSAQFSGPLKLTVAAWNAVLEGEAPAGLVRGATYYVSSATAGKLTTVASSDAGDVNTKVGIGLSTDTLMVQIGDEFEVPGG